nr:PAS domain-containing protein [Sphingomonas sp. ID1715]
MTSGRIHRSPEYLEIQGLPADAPLTGVYADTWLERVHPDDRAQVLAWSSEDFAAPCDFAREYRIVRPDTGETRWINSRGRVEGDTKGQPTRMVCAQTDITDRKLGELRSRYMAELAELLRQSQSPRAAMHSACAHLGGYLGATFVGFGEIAEGMTHVEVVTDWASGGKPSRAGRYPLDLFGEEVLGRLKCGEPFALDDLVPWVGPQPYGTRAVLEIPVLRAGDLIAVLAIFQDEPRHWTDHEIGIARLTAERIDEAVRRARAEEALRQSEERMRLAIAGTGLGYYDLDLQTGEGIWSDTAFNMLGLPAGSDQRASVAMWVSTLHPDDREAVAAAHAKAAERGGPWELEHRVVQRSTGATRWLHTFGQFIGAPGSRRSVGVVVDVTDRKEAELRRAILLRVSDRLRGATDVQAATNDIAEMLARELAVDTVGFVQIDPQRMQATILSGFTTRERPDSLSVEIGPERGPLRGASVLDLAHGRTFRLADAATDPRTRDKASEIEAASGAMAAIHVPMMREGGIGAVLFLHSAEPRDWTDAEVRLVEEVAARTWEAVERIRAEIAVRETNRNLAEQVAVAVAERESALAQLHQAQKLETIGQLTGGIAHDFNNLLTPITGALDLIRHRVADQDARLAKLVDGALQSADRARVLVQRLLSFARRQPLQPVAINLAELLDGMRDLIASSAGRGIELCIDAPSALPPAIADPNQLELAILNLCVNARDAMPQGGQLAIRVVGETDPERADLAPGDYLRISVQDSGIGMDEETLRLAVEPFFSTKPKERGTGLGLSMVHGLAGQLGGALAIDSAPGKGTCVDLWLPAAAAPAIAKAPSPVEAVDALPSLKVLLVDDEELVRSGTAEMLRDLGHEVDEAASGREALARLDGTRYDALVTDYMMPGMDGGQLAARAREIAPEMAVLLITGFIGSAEHAEHLPRLAKPFARGELSNALAKVMAMAG